MFHIFSFFHCSPKRQRRREKCRPEWDERLLQADLQRLRPEEDSDGFQVSDYILRARFPGLISHFLWMRKAGLRIIPISERG